jgi:hypothetical protein
MTSFCTADRHVRGLIPPVNAHLRGRTAIVAETTGRRPEDEFRELGVHGGDVQDGRSRGLVAAGPATRHDWTPVTPA